MSPTKPRYYAMVRGTDGHWNGRYDLPDAIARELLATGWIKGHETFAPHVPPATYGADAEKCAASAYVFDTETDEVVLVPMRGSRWVRGQGYASKNSYHYTFAAWLGERMAKRMLRTGERVVFIKGDFFARVADNAAGAACDAILRHLNSSFCHSEGYGDASNNGYCFYWDDRLAFVMLPKDMLDEDARTANGLAYAIAQTYVFDEPPHASP